MAASLLIVDDEIPLLRNLSSYLSAFNDEFRVQTAPSAEEALMMLDGDKDIEILLTDVRLPGLDGIELVRRVAAMGRNISILVMTAYSSTGVQASATSAGALRYLEKPLDVKRLRTILLDVATTRRGWSGSIGGLDLFDFTQLLLLSGKSTSIRVEHGDEHGSLVFHNGTLVHASTPQNTGELAFYEMGNWQGGNFKEITAEETVRCAPNINASTNQLMMEAARRRDESQRNGSEADVFTSVENGRGDDAESDTVQQKGTKEDRKMAIKDHLNDFEEIQGFKGVAVFTSNGEMLEGVSKGKTDIKTVGMFANNALLNAQKATDQMGVGRGNLMQIRAPEAVVLMRCLNEATDFAATKEGKAHFHTVVVLDPEGNTGMASMLLDRAVGKIAEELR